MPDTESTESETFQRLKKIRDRQIKTDGQRAFKFKDMAKKPKEKNTLRKTGSCFNCGDSVGCLNSRVRIKVPNGTDLIICRECDSERYPDVVKKMIRSDLILFSGDEIKWRHAKDRQTHAYHPGSSIPLCKKEVQFYNRDVDPVSMGLFVCKQCRARAGRQNMKQ